MFGEEHDHTVSTTPTPTCDAGPALVSVSAPELALVLALCSRAATKACSCREWEGGTRQV